MKPILTITVPTYNRPDKLVSLAKQFLLQASMLERIEVVICDNSDEALAKENQAIFQDSAVCYVKNKENVGFHGNLMQCVDQANGEWLWIISDDDEVDLQAFHVLHAYLLETDYPQSCHAVILPFEVKGKLVNTADTWSHANSIEDMLVQAKCVPFILFSGVLLRLETKQKQSALAEVYSQYAPNDYMQVMLFAELIDDGQIAYWHGQALQVYQPAYEGRFPLRELMLSMDGVLDFLHVKRRVGKEVIRQVDRKLLHGWIIWYAKHRAGDVKIQAAEEAKGLLLKRTMVRAGIKGKLLLFMALLLPRSLFRLVWKRLS